VSERSSWALVKVDDDGQPEAVLMLLDEQAEADEIAFELRRLGRRVRVVPVGPEQEPPPPEP